MPLRWDVDYEFCYQTRPEPKHKYLIVVHVDAEYVLAFFINSRVPRFVRGRHKLQPCMVLLDERRYDFLRRPSWLSCMETLTFRPHDLNARQGRLRQQDVKRVRAAVDACPLLKRKTKRILRDETR